MYYFNNQYAWNLFPEDSREEIKGKNAGIPHEELLKNIRCKTIFMKAKTDASEDGILMAAFSEDDLKRVSKLIPKCEIAF